MVTIEHSPRRLTALRDADGWVVESPYGDVGEVEEVWLDGERPCALAVRVKDGRRALLLERDVAAIDPEHRWVVVPEEAHLLELDAPRLSGAGVPTASWTTTGNEVPIAPAALTADHPEAQPIPHERPLWEMIAILYVGLLVVVAFVMALAFIVALYY